MARHPGFALLISGQAGQGIQNRCVTIDLNALLTNESELEGHLLELELIHSVHKRPFGDYKALENLFRE